MKNCYLLTNGFIFRTFQDCSWNEKQTLKPDNGGTVEGTLRSPFNGVDISAKNVILKLEDVVLHFQEN